jgi:hypothetical protein
VIKKDKLVPVPKILAPGLTEFRLYLTDLSYFGANYRGYVCLKPTPAAVAAGAPADPPKFVVTAGL